MNFVDKDGTTKMYIPVDTWSSLAVNLIQEDSRQGGITQQKLLQSGNWGNTRIIESFVCLTGLKIDVYLWQKNIQGKTSSLKRP